MITANQPHVTNLPVQVRCSSQPTGLRSSLRRIQRRKNETQKIGVQNVASNQSRRAEGGSCCHERRVFAPASHVATNNSASDSSASSPTARNICAADANRI